MKKKLERAAYVIIPLLFLLSIIGYEFYWRYEPKLDLTIHGKIFDRNKIKKTIVFVEHGDSPVDTTRREFKDARNSETTVYIFLDAGKPLADSSKQQIIMFDMKDGYISDARQIHISTDSSTQLLLIPNILQPSETGSNKIIYLKDDTTFGLKYFSGFIADVDKDGSEEVNIVDKGWMKLDTRTGEWIPAVLKK